MWTLEKINQFIKDGIEENTHLDYKGAGSIDNTNEKKKEISKDISAFANSAGGTIIYGVKEFDDREKNHLPEKIDYINGQLYTKEWLEQIIISSITPRIEGLKIWPIQVDEPEKNNVIYVVDIPKSYTAHQAKDKRYYRRFNFTSQIMEDWEIKDIINRLERTNIQLFFETSPPKNIINNYLESDISFDFDVHIWAENKGNKVVKYLHCFINAPHETAKNIIVPVVNQDTFQKVFSNEKQRKITIYQEEVVIGVERAPILPNTSINLGMLKLRSDFIRDNCELGIQIATDDNSKNIFVNAKDIFNED